MKTNFIKLLVLLFTVYIFNSCKSDSSTEPSGEVVADETYFPTAEGTFHKYSVNRTDASNIQTAGTRSSIYLGTRGIYQIELDSLIFPDSTNIDSAFFRKTSTGVFFFLDTTGLASVIPDSLLPSLTFDAEMRAFLFPINEESSWPVFKMNLTIQGFIFSPVELNAIYMGKETLVFNLINGNETIEAIKIRFMLVIRTGLFSPAINYDAFVWLAKDKGIVKWQGNGTIVNAFTGGGIVFDDTSSTITQNLIEYDIN